MRVMVGFAMLVGLMAGVATWIDDRDQTSRSVEGVWMAEDQVPAPTPRPPMR